MTPPTVQFIPAGFPVELIQFTTAATTAFTYCSHTNLTADSKWDLRGSTNGVSMQYLQQVVCWFTSDALRNEAYDQFSTWDLFDGVTSYVPSFVEKISLSRLRFNFSSALPASRSVILRGTS
jgi:hypothetical protein